MTVKNKYVTAHEKMEQYKHQQILRENREKKDQANIDLRRKVLVGEIFIKHFPIVLKFTPKSPDEDNLIFKPLDDFMDSLSKCHECFQVMKDELHK